MYIHSALPVLSKTLSVGEPTLQLIIDGLSQLKGFRDIRESMEPLLRRGDHRDPRPGEVVRGRVANVTDFGIFVDIGIGQVHHLNCLRIVCSSQVSCKMAPMAKFECAPLLYVRIK